jgi:hypothetical protein
MAAFDSSPSDPSTTEEKYVFPVDTTKYSHSASFAPASAT